MPQSVHCPHCKGSVGVAEDDLGFHVTCPHCAKDFLAPGAAVSSKSTSNASADDDDDWLNLDEKPLGKPLSSSKSGGMDDDDLLAQYTDSADDFTSETESLPSAKSVSKPAGKTNAAFEDLDLPDFVDDGPPALESQKVNPAKAVDDEYRIKCKTCGSPTYVKPRQQGKTVRCVDCHSELLVPPPPKPAKKPARSAAIPKSMPLQGSAKNEGRKDPFRRSAEDLLRKAEEAEVEEPPTDYDTPDLKEWLTNVFGIFRDSGVLFHWLAFSALAGIPTYVALRSEHPMLIAGLFPFGVFAGALISACGFAILESVANKQDSVTNWPIFDPFSWFGQLFLVSAAAALPIVPVAAFFAVLGGPSVLALLMGMFAVYLLFPFVLLSMMDMDSPLVPFSAEVARSVTKCQEAWGGLYFSSAILFAGLFLLILMMGSAGGIIVSITASIGVIFIYFAMIGRLAFAIGHVKE